MYFVTYTDNAIHRSNLITYMQNVKLIFVVNSGLKQKKDPTKIWKKWVMPLQASTKIFSKKKKKTLVQKYT